jgi:hypothetical protein
MHKQEEAQEIFSIKFQQHKFKFRYCIESIHIAAKKNKTGNQTFLEKKIVLWII